jgi:hypothetical protein
MHTIISSMLDLFTCRFTYQRVAMFQHSPQRSSALARSRRLSAPPARSRDFLGSARRRDKYASSLKHRQLSFTHLHRPPHQPRLTMMVERADHRASSRRELTRLDRHAGGGCSGQDARRETEGDGGGEVIGREVGVGGAGLRGGLSANAPKGRCGSSSRRGVRHR